MSFERSIKFSQAPLPLGITSNCVVCDKPFATTIYRGRPQKFCGDTCRRTQFKNQKAAWAERAKSASAKQ